ncbi:HET-domain-containing protein [Dendrothele bispora CBS 962.96]|uniref:HET-domain-containing protein n=1 Tax=Dendrothele bispora (strain CBS 962.96) TaxID=1314807 RepID=A0A4S8MFI0_DENBC|nr:HET-domain-containing protein [Dendrothele bispora CBS 962.96]
MRLLNTTTLQLVEFFRDIPPYVILSHTWGPEEVSFQDLRDPVGKAKQMAGYYKIEKSCELARRYHFDYIWIDTCCIDKQSSAELSEAINSMYRYYRWSHVCYAFLADVTSDEDPRASSSTFRNSRWFTRGWTLQELLAPTSLVFLDRDWVEIGSKHSLKDVLTILTGIPSQVLLGDLSIKASIASRMSWAANRQTTRPEDVAYCLMGIFNVNMPTLYGEGAERAFIRLQREIIKYSDDQSIFAWRSSLRSGESDSGVESGLLARSPEDFAGSSGFSATSSRDVSAFPYAMTNLGLHIQLPLIHVHGADRIYLAVLNCRSDDRAVGIYLHRRYPLGQQFVRVRLEEIAMSNDWIIPPEKEEIYVLQLPSTGVLRSQPAAVECLFEIRSLPSIADFRVVHEDFRYDSWRGRDHWMSQPFRGGEISLTAGEHALLYHRNDVTEDQFLVEGIII